MFSNDEFVYVIRHLTTKIKFLIPCSLSTVISDRPSLYNGLIADEGINPISSYKVNSLGSFDLFFNYRFNHAEDLKKLYHNYLSNIRENGYNGYGIPIYRISKSYVPISEIYEYSKNRLECNIMERRRKKKINYRSKKFRYYNYILKLKV